MQAHGMQHVGATDSEGQSWGLEARVGDPEAQGPWLEGWPGTEVAKAEAGRGWVMSCGMRREREA